VKGGEGPVGPQPEERDDDGMSHATAPKFCPYCGGDALKFVGMVPRCMDCRAVFHLIFSRWVRTSPVVRPKTANSDVQRPAL
jgi:hypothetical protein